jgi:hypothetical protein
MADPMPRRRAGAGLIRGADLVVLAGIAAIAAVLIATGLPPFGGLAGWLLLN